MNYYHAGVENDSGDVRWSKHTRRSYGTAVREARRMAQAGGRPIVEWWDRQHGLRPGDCEVLAGSEYVDER